MKILTSPIGPNAARILTLSDAVRKQAAWGREPEQGSRLGLPRSPEHVPHPASIDDAPVHHHADITGPASKRDASFTLQTRAELPSRREGNLLEGP
jgi:hypothetical protein